jgi:hypothetical protein
MTVAACPATISGRFRRFRRYTLPGRSAISIAIGPARQAIFDTSQRPVFAIGSDAEEAPRALHETTMRDA